MVRTDNEADATARAADVLAVVVTFNPEQALASHLAALREQVAHVVVVDNGSTDLESVRAACNRTGCRLIANGRNVGVAAALNQAVAEAFACGASWLATFDQDSLVPPGAIGTLLALASDHPRRDTVGIVSMSHRDRGTGKPYHVPSEVIEQGPNWRMLRTTITSGSLVRTEVLRQIGGFESRLFIDFVDHEFCFRMRRHGWSVLEAADVTMSHTLGASRVHSFLGRDLVLTHHSAQRRYYMTRNQLEVYCRNLFFDPRWALRGLSYLVGHTAVVLLVEEQRAAKLAAVAQGFFDFVTRRFGPRPAAWSSKSPVT